MSDRDLAIELLKAVACCTVRELHCYDCPLYDETGRCRPWTDEEVAQAVRTLNGERNTNETDL